jgi:hypothetical protein
LLRDIPHPSYYGGEIPINSQNASRQFARLNLQLARPANVKAAKRRNPNNIWKFNIVDVYVSPGDHKQFCAMEVKDEKANPVSDCRCYPEFDGSRKDCRAQPRTSKPSCH